MDTNLKKFLRTFTGYYHNPFLNKNFSFTGRETLGEGKNTHHIMDIRLIFKNNSLSIKFKPQDFILALVILLDIRFSPFDFDKGAKASFGDLILNLNGGPNSSHVAFFKDLFFVILPHLVGDATILLEFSNDEEGRDSFSFHKQQILYVIDEDHDDSFYLAKELER